MHYKEINKRVDADMETERKLLEKEMEERRERIRKLRAERERQEALRNQALAARNQAPGVPDSDDSDVVVSDVTQGPGSSGIPNVRAEGTSVCLLHADTFTVGMVVHPFACFISFLSTCCTWMPIVVFCCITALICMY